MWMVDFTSEDCKYIQIKNAGCRDAQPCVLPKTSEIFSVIALSAPPN